MGKENEITSEGFAGGKATNDRITAKQALGLVEAHKSCIQGASKAAWDKIEVFFERFQQVEDDLRDAKSNIEPNLDRVPLEDVRGAVIAAVEDAANRVDHYISNVHMADYATNQRSVPSKDELNSIGVLLSIVRRYLSSIRDA